MKEVIFILQHYSCGNTRVLSPTTCFLLPLRLPQRYPAQTKEVGVPEIIVLVLAGLLRTYAELVALVRKGSGIRSPI